MNTESLSYSDAMTLLLRWLRKPDHGNYGIYGYEVYLPHLVRTYLKKEEQGIHNQKEQDGRLKNMMPSLYEAAWDLCRRGILRPGVRCYGGQATEDGASGNGYSITSFGDSWLAERDFDDFVPTEKGRFSEMLAPYKKRFGPSFHERAQEAIKCYGAHAYLACCAMCGAAAEAMLITAAIAKKDEKTVLKEYFSSGGRKKIENLLIGKAKKYLRDEYRGYMSLLKYWRDDAAHGKISDITDNEAYTSLALLLRLAAFIDDHWNELTQREQLPA